MDACMLCHIVSLCSLSRTFHWNAHFQLYFNFLIFYNGIYWCLVIISCTDIISGSMLRDHFWWWYKDSRWCWGTNHGRLLAKQVFVFVYIFKPATRFLKCQFSWSRQKIIIFWAATRNINLCVHLAEVIIIWRCICL